MDLVVCRQRVMIAGGRVVQRGAILAADDDAVKRAPFAFRPVEQVVEQATAAPGEKRSTRRAKATDDTEPTDA
jgi:hypothetical protein